ncbi:MAG: DUF4173 domain-containing protein [Clostridiales bacterium]|nr:DUF4173 domain-containing protein [Clostridiales bacterium]
MENKKTFGMAGILLAYPVAYIYLRLLICFPFTQDISKYGFIGATIFVILFIIYNEVVRKGRGKSSPKITYFWYGVMGLTALTVNIAPSYVLSIFAIHLCAVYGVLVSGNVLYEGKTGSYIVSDLLNGAFVKTFPNFGNIFSDIKEFRSSKDEQKTEKSAKGILGGVILLLVMIPVFLIVIGLLGAVNYEFARISNELLNNIDFEWLLHLHFADVFTRIIFAVPVTFYLYSLVSACAKEDGSKERERFTKKAEARSRRRIVSPVFTSIISGMFVLTYVFFFLLEGKYIFSAFLGKLPEGFNVVDYARRGFFDLVGIMAINILIFLVINAFEKRDSVIKVSRFLTICLMGESIVFAVVALCKLLMYFTTFGYTPKRMLAMWGCVVMGAAAVFVIMNLIKAGDHARKWIIFTAVSYVAMCLLAGIFILTDYRGNAPAADRDETVITFFNNTNKDIKTIEYSLEEYNNGEYETIDKGIADFEEDGHSIFDLIIDGRVDYGDGAYASHYYYLVFEDGSVYEMHLSYMSSDPGVIEIYSTGDGDYRYSVDHK